MNYKEHLGLIVAGLATALSLNFMYPARSPNPKYPLPSECIDRNNRIADIKREYLDFYGNSEEIKKILKDCITIYAPGAIQLEEFISPEEYKLCIEERIKKEKIKLNKDTVSY